MVALHIEQSGFRGPDGLGMARETEAIQGFDLEMVPVPFPGVLRLKISGIF